MEINFLGSFEQLGQLPETGLPEFAFIGRSNVGKSSFINALTQRKNLAHTSSTPGKTRLLNLFQVGSDFIIVDLPGYGYARLSKKERVRLAAMISHYLEGRQPLFLVFQLLDLRLPPQKVDMEMLRKLGEQGLPVCLIYTKSDKLKPREIEANLKAYEEAILQDWETMPVHFITSSQTGTGREEVLAYIHSSIREHLPS
jgi:GTP-binding protein